MQKQQNISFGLNWLAEMFQMFHNFDETKFFFCTSRSSSLWVWAICRTPETLFEDTKRPARHSIEPVLKSGNDIALDIDLIICAYLMFSTVMSDESSFHGVYGTHVVWNTSFEAYYTTKGMFQRNLVHISRHFLPTPTPFQFGWHSFWMSILLCFLIQPKPAINSTDD